MTLPLRNLLADLPSLGSDEAFEVLLETPGWKLERIVSHGHATPPGQWFDQDRPEWVMVLAGRARLQIEGEEAIRELGCGDAILLPAHVRHRVAWTDPTSPTIWLALHFEEPAPTNC